MANQTPHSSSWSNGHPPAPSTADESTRMILEYLNRRGHTKAAAALSADLAGHSNGPPVADAPASNNAAAAAAPSSSSSSPAVGSGKAVGLEDFAERNAPSAPRTTSSAPPPSSSAAGQPATSHSQAAQGRRRPDQVVAGSQMLADPPSWEKGYEGLRTFVENSLDIHRPELLPILLPLFVHSYLDLVLVSYREAADHLLQRFSSDHSASDPHIVRMLAAIRLPQHVSESEEATRWRQERYAVRLSERGWGLLLGWLQGGGLAGSIEGTEARGRDRVLAIINERVKIDAIPGPPAKTVTEFGLLSDFNHTTRKPPSKGLEQLKLGPGPVDLRLQREVDRTIKEEDFAGPVSSGATQGALDTSANPNGLDTGTEGIAKTGKSAPTAATETNNSPDPNAMDVEQDPAESSVPTTIDFADKSPQQSSFASLVSPAANELPPYPSTLRTIDVAREVEKVREARKRIKLGADAYSSTTLKSAALTTSVADRKLHSQSQTGEAAKPSVCLFTVHDSGDSLTTVTFSEDSTLMAVGFSESYIRLWNLKGEKLTGMRNDFDSDQVRDTNDLKRLRQQDGPTSRKLIGHSGPVYALSFDPVPGPSGPPRYLLSASQDTTVRLWSLETYTNLVAYRGHREPIWDVEWGPRGIYFATASRDRTARLWSADKTAALRIFAGHLSDVNCVKFHPNSLYLATGSSDRTCRLWDVQKGLCVRVFVGHRGAVHAIALSPDGRYLASAADDLSIILWDLASGRKIKSMTGHTSSIYSLSFSAESTVLVSGSADATVRVWDVLKAPAPVTTSTTFTLSLLDDDSTGAALGVPGASENGKNSSGIDSSMGNSGAGGGGGMEGDGSGGGGRSGTSGGVVVLGSSGSVRRVSGVGLPEGGVEVNSNATLGLLPKGAFAMNDVKGRASTDLLATLATKQTAVFKVHFTPRNLCLAAGPMEQA